MEREPHQIVLRSNFGEKSKLLSCTHGVQENFFIDQLGVKFWGANIRKSIGASQSKISGRVDFVAGQRAATLGDPTAA